MTVVETTPTAQTAALSFEFDLQHSPAKVWRALTDPELLAQWLLPVVGFDIAPGATFSFKTEPVGGWDGVVHCRTLESEQERKLKYAWVVGDMDTVVTFTLTPTATGTHMRLVHAGFQESQKRNFGGARYGWNMMGGKLLTLLETLP